MFILQNHIEIKFGIKAMANRKLDILNQSSNPTSKEKLAC
jgi:hypothetical protein